jgi:hypothetical protein
MHAVEAEVRSVPLDPAMGPTTSATAPTQGALPSKRLT